MRKVIPRVTLVLLLSAGLLGDAWAKEPPASLNGLAMTEEKIGKGKKSAQTQYLTDITLYSLRQPSQQLEATIQVGRLKRGTPAASISFQREIAGQVGTTVPQEHRVGGTALFVTRVRKLSVAIWFKDGHLFVLSIREGYAQPKTLIRQAMAMDP